MSSNSKPPKKGISRGKFFRFLGGIGLLSLIPGIPALAEERKLEVRKFGGLRRTETAKLLRSPTIKGQLLSNDVLTASLSTKNLENIRDMMTGRFFGRVAENAFRDGYVPLIKWGLGREGSDNGCFFYAIVKPGDLEPEAMSNCTLLFIAREDGKMIFLDIYSTSAMAQGPLHVGSEIARPDPPCPDLCGSQCSDHCGGHCDKCGFYCSGTFCNPHSSVDLSEIVSNPSDKFASELTDILKTTDIDKIQQELKTVIFSDEVLNMGLQHFVEAAHQSMVDEFDGN